jgi:hypothetical protein
MFGAPKKHAKEFSIFSIKVQSSAKEAILNFLVSINDGLCIRL